MKRRNSRGRQGRKGFTLIEVVVVLAIVALLAAILTPLLLKYLEDAKIGRARNEVLVIGSAILNFNKDTGLWPVYTQGSSTAPAPAANAVVDALQTSDGTQPGTDAGGASDANVWPGGASAATACTAGGTTACLDSFENQLEKNTPGTSSTGYRTSGQFAWKGAYQAGMKGDPWGNKYLANVKHLQPTQLTNNRVVWVLSAGPDRQVSTSFAQSATSCPCPENGDDIAFRIR